MRTYLPLTTLCGIILLTGCTSTADLGPTFDHDGMPRSLALNSSQQPQTYGWWDTRNDYERSAIVPLDGLVVDVSEQTTYDRLYSHDGDVDDDYQQRTRKTRIRQYAP